MTKCISAVKEKQNQYSVFGPAANVTNVSFIRPFIALKNSSADGNDGPN